MQMIDRRLRKPELRPSPLDPMVQRTGTK